MCHQRWCIDNLRTYSTMTGKVMKTFGLFPPALDKATVHGCSLLPYFPAGLSTYELVRFCCRREPTNLRAGLSLIADTQARFPS